MREYKPIIDQDSLRIDLIKRVAEQEGLPYKVVEKIIMFQYKDLRDNAKNCNDIEITGLGLIKTSKPLTIRRLNMLRGQAESIRSILSSTIPRSEKRLQNYRIKLMDLETKISHLEERLRIYESRH